MTKCRWYVCSSSTSAVAHVRPHTYEVKVMRTAFFFSFLVVVLFSRLTGFPVHCDLLLGQWAWQWHWHGHGAPSLV